ncbi:MAG: hypothetical protein LBE08_06360 [Bifidobacteriaceae bacterium]|jgi:hypothetical protein|nr:hypothetical protein [Bifidobacteriaceae bacterium]
MPKESPRKRSDGERRPKSEVRQRLEKERQAKRDELERALKALSVDDKRRLARVRRFMTGFGFLALAAMIALSLPLPWPAAGIVAMVAGVIAAIRGIVLARHTPFAGGAVTYLALGLVLLGIFAVYCIPLVASWEEQWAYQQCLRQTQTIEGEDACRASFEQATEADWRRLFQRGSD